MTVSMGQFVALAVIGCLVVTAAVELTGWRRLSCWMLALIPASLCAACLVDLFQGAAKIGASAYRSGQLQLIPCMVFLAVSLFAALRPGWRWLFWLAWGLNAIICGILVYLAFFWKVFS